ncbi:response regulator transcription factor [Eisenbergiella sp.]
MYRIMAVDDEPYVLEELHLLLDSHACDAEIVKECSYGSAALEMLPVCKPDIVITDICMPDIDGLELIREIRQKADYPIVFIVLSGYGQFDYGKQALKLGVIDYLVKPVFEEELLDALARAKRQLKEEYKKEALRHKLAEPFTRTRPVEETFYELQDGADVKISYQLPVFGDILGAILLLSDNAALECADVYFEECRSRFTEPGLVKTGVVNLLCDAGKEVQLQQLFIIKDWVEIINGCNTLTSLRLKTGDWIVFCCKQLQYRRLDKGNGLAAELKKYAEENYLEPLSLTQIASRLHASPVYLGQAFAKAYGEHFHAYLKRIRIEEAKRLLVQTKLTVKVISQKAGYENYQVFKKHFAQITGMPPAAYRKYEMAGREVELEKTEKGDGNETK